MNGKTYRKLFRQKAIRESQSQNKLQEEEEMELVKVLGRGSYGTVEIFRHTQSDGSMFLTAVKTVHSYNYASIDREIRVLSELRGCPCVVQLCGGKSLVQAIDCNGANVYKMSMEYAAGGTLTSLMDRNRNRTKKLSDSAIRDFTRMIVQGLVSIHSHGYVHCDLKPDNLLLFPVYDKETSNSSYDLKIADFGLTVRAGDESHCWTVNEPWVGTPTYMSPESVRDGTTIEKTLDLWSLGCIVLEMFTGEQTWFGYDLDGVKSLLLDEKAPEIPESVPCDARRFLDKCFSRIPEERGTASELLLHPFLTGDEEMGSPAGESTDMVFRLVKVPAISKYIPTEPLELKVILQKLRQFKKVRILPPRPPTSVFVPVC